MTGTTEGSQEMIDGFEDEVEKEKNQSAVNFQKRINAKKVELNTLNRLLKHKKSDLEKKAR